jgi:hypothetical protein
MTNLEEIDESSSQNEESNSNDEAESDRSSDKS